MNTKNLNSARDVTESIEFSKVYMELSHLYTSLYATYSFRKALNIGRNLLDTFLRKDANKFFQYGSTLLETIPNSPSSET